MNEILAAFSATTGVRTFSVSAAGTQVTRGEAALALAPLSQILAGRSASEPTVYAPVELSAGTLVGYVDNGIYTFKGVPYATAERFKEPVPVTKYEDGTQMALSYGPVSPQSRTINDGTGSIASVNVVEFVCPSGASDMVSAENCQTLNVWTDSLTGSKPVVVFFHGGGVESGTSNELKYYTGEYFAASEDVVFVSVTHRLNYFGYLDLSHFGAEYANSGSVGQLDCVAALQWVRDNIAKFGGDPSNVTILGQSGGGQKVSGLACMPAAEGLFDKVVSASGYFSYTPANGNPEWIANMMKNEGWKTEMELLDNLLSMSSEELYQVCRRNSVRYGVTYGNGAMPAPLFDENGKINPLAAKRTWMIGTVFGENAASNGAWLAGDFGYQTDYLMSSMPNDEAAMARLTDRYGTNAPAIAEAFRAAYPDHELAEAMFLNNRATSGPYSRNDLICQDDTGVGVLKQFNDNGVPVYNYVDSYRLPMFGGIEMSHTLDLAFWFNSLDTVPYMIRGDEVNARKVAKTMADTLASFAANGDPSLPTLRWTPYTNDAHSTMVLDVNSTCKTDYDAQLISLVIQGKAE